MKTDDLIKALAADAPMRQWPLVTVIAFALFRSPVKWNYFVSYAMIVGAVYFAFKF